MVEHIYMFVCMCVFASDNINTYKYKQLLQNKEFYLSIFKTFCQLCCIKCLRFLNQLVLKGYTKAYFMILIFSNDCIVWHVPEEQLAHSMTRVSINLCKILKPVDFNPGLLKLKKICNICLKSARDHFITSF